MLSSSQTKWIFQKANELVNNYEQNFPSTDEDWSRLANDARELCKNSRDDELCKQVVFGILTYFENKGKELEHGKQGK